MYFCLYVIGVPGSGKTTVLNAAMRFVGFTATEDNTPFLHEILRLPDRPLYRACYLVRHRGKSSGTDALSMSAITLVEEWLPSCGMDLIIGEGDRLANIRFFAACEAAGYALRLVYLDTPDAIAAKRRLARGRRQDSRWVKGRYTKVAHLARFAHDRLDGSQPVGTLALQLAHIITQQIGAHRGRLNSTLS